MPSLSFRRTLGISLACALWLLAHLSMFAADRPEPWNSPHFSIDPKALYTEASEVSAPEGTNQSMLDEESTFSFDSKGRVVLTEYLVYKVLTQKGVEGWDSLSVDWEPWHEERPILKARVVSADFTVHSFDPKTLTDAPESDDDADVYGDRRVLRAPLPAMAPGSVVEQEIVTVTNPVFPGAGYTGRRTFGRVGVPVQHYGLVLDAPSSLTLQHVLQMLPDLKPLRTEAEGRARLDFEYGPAAPLEEVPDYLPRDQFGYPTILFSVGTTWPQVASAYGQIVEGTLAGAQVKPLVEKLTRGKTSRQEKEQAILAFLNKEIRYTGIEFGDNSVIPHPTAETLTRKYGDCKDKSLLLVAMLRAAEIPAYMALLNVEGDRLVLPEIPGMEVFDHAIVFVPGSPELWIDPTDQYSRLGQLPIHDQGQSALVIGSGTPSLVKTPEDASGANLIVEVREIHLAENGPARIVETTQPHGCFESSHRRDYVDSQDKKTRENLASYFKSQYLADKLDRWDRSDPSDFSHPFELVLESKKAKRGLTDLDSAVAAIRLEGIFSLLPDELQKREDPDDKSAEATKKKRTADYELSQAAVKEWQYRIFPPLGYQPESLPGDVKVAVGPALLTEQFSTEGDGVVRAVIRFDTVKRRYSVAEATELRNKVAEIEGGEAILINFQPLARVLQKQGKMRESSSFIGI